MNCNNCGKPIAGEINFCPYCGKPVDRSLGPTDTSNWEYCQIEASWAVKLISYRCQFWANAVGRNGTYCVGWSDVYTVRSNPPAGPAGQGMETLSTLASSLAGDGWEATPERGESWWMLRFRRRECYPDFSMGQVDSKQTNRFDGEWTFNRCAGSGRYDMEISGLQGKCTMPYSQNIRKGERMLRINGVAGDKFTGEHLFSDGWSWHKVTGVLEGATLWLRGPSQIWRLDKQP